jgi:hypothetical protein
MKIALCLKGQPRNYYQGYLQIKREILDKYDVDIFAHCWWDKSKIGKPYSTAPWASKLYLIEDNVPENLYALYNFKAITFESPKTFITKRSYNIPRDPEKSFDSYMSNYYSQNKVLSLVKDHEKINGEYDWLILTRYDIGISNFLNLNELDKDNIYVSNFHVGRKFIFNDNLWVFGLNHKFVFIDLYEKFDEVYDKAINMPQNYKNIVANTELETYRELSSELHIATHLLFKNVLNKVITLDNYYYDLLR